MKHLLFLAAAAGIMFYLARGTVVPGPYTYDEPDYVYAASLGWIANATDSPTMPLSEFLRLGLNRRRNAGPSAELSELIRNRGDLVFYRHWHGPVYSAWLAAVSALKLSEHATRACNFVFPVVTAALMYFGALWLLPGAAGQTAAILATIFYLWSYPAVRTTELAPHQLFALCATLVLLLCARLFTQPSRRVWYAAVMICGVAFCVLEIAFALIFALLVCGHLVRHQLKPDAAFASRSAGLFAATVFVLWPAAVLKLSFIKAYLFMAYLALARSGSWGQGVGLMETWWLRFVESPVPWIAAAFGFVYFLKRRRESPVLIPFVIFATAMTAAILPVKTEMARYTLPLWPGVVLLGAFAAGLALEKWNQRARFGAIAILSVAMIASGWPSLRGNMPQRDTGDESLLALIRERGSGKTILVPHESLPMLHYYFPDARFRSYYEESSIPDQIREGGIDGVIDRGDPARWIAVQSAQKNQ